jgi:1-acyl-sn-glycerol-3-phosphate acyltransferase
MYSASMRILRSVIFNILFYGSTGLMALTGWPALWMHRGALLAIRASWIAVSMWLIRWVAGIQVEVRNADRLPKGPVLVASKHQSAWETIWFNQFLEVPAIVLKKELTEIPILGAMINGAGMVPIDREGGAPAIKRMVLDSKAAIADGRPVLIFPQGTRVAPGADGLYHPGVFALYRSIGLPMIPVALNSGIYWSRNAFIKTPGTVIVEFLEPIEPGLDRATFMERLQTTIDGASDRLADEAREAMRTAKP